MKKNLDEKKAKDLFNLLFKLLEDKRLPYELRAEYIEKIGVIVRGEKNSN